MKKHGKNNGKAMSDHFANVRKMVTLSSHFFGIKKTADFPLNSGKNGVIFHKTPFIAFFLPSAQNAQLFDFLGTCHFTQG